MGKSWCALSYTWAPCLDSIHQLIQSALKKSRPNRLPTPFVACVLLALPALIASCSSTQGSPRPRNQVSSLVRYGRFEEARTLAQKLLAQSPEDPRAKRDLRDTEVALKLNLGIEQLFLDREEGALRHFYDALGMDPDNKMVQHWVQKVNVQIAEDSLTMAARIAEREDPEAKVAALRSVLDHLPLDIDGERIQGLRAKAIRGLISVEMFQAYDRGGTYTTYQDGLRDLNRSMVAGGLGETVRSGIISTFAVKVSGVERRFIQADRYEQEGLLLAARFMYGVVISLEPEHQDAGAGIARIGPLLKGLQLGVLKGPKDSVSTTSSGKSMDPLDTPVPPMDPEKQVDPQEQVNPEKQVDPSVEDTVASSAANGPAVEAKLGELYASAIELEEQGMLASAVEVFDQIARLRVGYRDVAERRETITEFIDHAESLYTKAQDADEQATAISYLLRIAAFWPSYRDVSEQIKSRRAAMVKDSDDAN